MAGQVKAAHSAARRVVIVDDSPTGRALIRRALQSEPRLTIIGEAADPIAARQLIRALAPDVLVLDIEMPHMNGLEFLRRLMRLRPMPVVMLSGLTAKGSSVAIEALAAGAVDCLEKTPHLFVPGNPTLACHVLAAAGARPLAHGPGRAAGKARGTYRANGKAILIGASTGGVEALERLFQAWPDGGPPVLIAQHMPAHYLTRFVARLDAMIGPEVAIATAGHLPQPGQIWFAPGGRQHLILQRGLSGPVCGLEEHLGNQGHCPSVARLFGARWCGRTGRLARQGRTNPCPGSCQFGRPWHAGGGNQAWRGRTDPAAGQDRRRPAGPWRRLAGRLTGHRRLRPPCRSAAKTSLRDSHAQTNRP
jgi:two-component system chemotaxis response regulator CheB